MDQTDRDAPVHHFEGPLGRLDRLYERRRQLLAGLSDAESQVEALEAEVCRALRHARRRGVAAVVFNETAYFERDGQLCTEHWAPAHEVPYEPAERPWHSDDRVSLTADTGPILVGLEDREC